MVIMHPGTIFQYDTDDPSLTVSGSKSRSAHRWKYCPYSTQITTYNQDSRIPDGEKTYHEETQGWLHTYSVGGPAGWVCADNGCGFWLGTATTAVPQAGRKFIPTSCPRTAQDFATLSGSVDHSTIPRPIVPGTRYLEI